jgi:hypothetical protein
LPSVKRDLELITFTSKIKFRLMIYSAAFLIHTFGFINYTSSAAPADLAVSSQHADFPTVGAIVRKEFLHPH